MGGTYSSAAPVVTSCYWVANLGAWSTPLSGTCKGKPRCHCHEHNRLLSVYSEESRMWLGSG